MYVYMDDCMRAYLPTAVAPAGRRHRSVWRTPQAVPGGPYRASRPRCRPATTPTGEPPAPPNPPPTGEDGRPRAATNWWHQGSRPPRGPAAQGPRRQLASEARHRPPAAAARSHQLVTAAQTRPGAPPPTGQGGLPGRQPPPCPRRQQLASVRPKARPRPTNWRARAGPSKAQGPPAPVRVPRGPRRQLASEARHRPAGGCHAPRGRRAPMSAPRQLAGRPRRRGRGRGARPSWDPPPSARRCRARWWEVSHTNLAKVGLTLSDS